MARFWPLGFPRRLPIGNHALRPGRRPRRAAAAPPWGAGHHVQDGRRPLRAGSSRSHNPDLPRVRSRVLRPPASLLPGRCEPPSSGRVRAVRGSPRPAGARTRPFDGAPRAPEGAAGDPVRAGAQPSSVGEDRPPRGATLTDMTNSNTSEPSKAPGFGAFLSPATTSGSTPDNTSSASAGASSARRAPGPAGGPPPPTNGSAPPRAVTRRTRTELPERPEEAATTTTEVGCWP